MPSRKRPASKPKPAQTKRSKSKHQTSRRRASRPISQRIGKMTGGTAAERIQCATFVAGNQHITLDFSSASVDKITELLVPLLARGGALQPADEAGRALRVEHGGESLTFSPGAAQALEKKRRLRSHLLALTLHQDYRAWATKFVPLAGRMDVRKTVEGMDIPVGYSEFRLPAGGEGQATYQPLEDIREAMHKHPAFVILGEPGAGKTTTLQKIAYDAAVSLLGGQPGRVPLFVRLSQQKGRDPIEFLTTEWRSRIGTPFAEVLAHGQCLLLVDGLNEVPRADREERLEAWRLFAKEYGSANQIIFSGRERDYAGQLELPRVRVDALDPKRIADYLQRNNAADFAPQLADPESRLLELARNPFYLSLLVYAYQSNQRDVSNRGRLFEWFVDNLFRREERHRAAHTGWIDRDAQMAALSRLAFAMQAQGESLTLSWPTARALLPGSVEVNGDDVAIRPADLFRCARAATLLDPSTEPDVRFYHHLLQEYFAALELRRRFDAGEDLSRLWHAPRLADAMPPANVGEWDALPEPPATGWEVTALLACGLTPDPARFIEAVRPHHAVLAGRCLVEAGVPASRLAGVKLQVQQDLLSELSSAALHLRARLQAGYTLGRIGDPRFESRARSVAFEGKAVRVIKPAMTPVPAGTYVIGSSDDDDEAVNWEKPQHTVELPAFSIGKWAVTNAEYACFTDAGGYNDDRWWQTDLAKRWLKGEDVMGGQASGLREAWQLIRTNQNWRELFAQTGSFSPSDIESYSVFETLADEAAYNEWAAKTLGSKSRERPQFWDDPDRNNPSQPVVGITWFEAKAYCAWLSAMLGRQYRLPTEVEWEAASRGLSPLPTGRSETGLGVRVYPWGDDWDSAKANTVEGRVLKPSPVGTYTAAGNISPAGMEDAVGNVWNWTSTLFGKDYPYRKEDGREDPQAEGERVVRGGSWLSLRGFARCASRLRYVPGGFANSLGFRVLSPVS